MDPRIIIPVIIVLYLSALHKSSVNDDVFKLPWLQLNPEGWLCGLPETSNATLPRERSTPRLEAHGTQSMFPVLPLPASLSPRIQVASTQKKKKEKNGINGLKLLPF